jgi:hypothetical protein
MPIRASFEGWYVVNGASGDPHFHPVSCNITAFVLLRPVPAPALANASVICNLHATPNVHSYVTPLVCGPFIRKTPTSTL